jgi:hypothetical protein
VFADDSALSKLLSGGHRKWSALYAEASAIGEEMISTEWYRLI